MADCDRFVVLLSRAALASSWVRKEISMAVALELAGRLKSVIPCLLERGLPLPILLADYVAVNLDASSFNSSLESLHRARSGDSVLATNVQRFRQYARTSCLPRSRPAFRKSEYGRPCTVAADGPQAFAVAHQAAFIHEFSRPAKSRQAMRRRDLRQRAECYANPAVVADRNRQAVARAKAAG